MHSYQTLALGAGKDDGRAYLALVHADAEAAEDNVGLLRR